MTTLFTYNADIGFVVGVPARDITDEDSEEVRAIAEQNSKTPTACYAAVTAPQQATRTAKAKAAADEGKSE